jgi:hypothetical protein
MTVLTKTFDGVVLPYTEEDYAQLEKDKAELAQLQQQSIPTKEELLAKLQELQTQIQTLG